MPLPAKSSMNKFQLLVALLVLVVLAECIQEAINAGRVFMAGILCFFVVVLGAVALAISIKLTEGFL